MEINPFPLTLVQFSLALFSLKFFARICTRTCVEYTSKFGQPARICVLWLLAHIHTLLLESYSVGVFSTYAVRILVLDALLFAREGQHIDCRTDLRTCSILLCLPRGSSSCVNIAFFGEIRVDVNGGKFYCNIAKRGK